MALPTRTDFNVSSPSLADFWGRWTPGDGDCWLWTGAVGNHGYGTCYDGVASRLAHRMAWVLHNGEQVPEGFTIDHVCHIRTCINPQHLRVLSNLDNATDNLQGSKTHCPKGHEYTEENTKVNGKGHRQCRACLAEFNRIQHEKKSREVRMNPSPLQRDALVALGSGEWKSAALCGGGVALGQALRQLAHKGLIERRATRAGPEYRGF